MPRRSSLPRFLSLLILSAAFAALLASCTANLEEGCLAGECVPPGSAPVPPEWPKDAGSDAPACMDTTDVGDFPCDVFALLQTHCQTCHQEPPLNGAPFSLLTYEDTQQPFGVMGQQRWQRMAEVVESGFMPPSGVVLPAADKEALLAWLTACAQPAPMGMGCE